MNDKLQVLEHAPLFAALGGRVMKKLAERAEFVNVAKGDVVVRENDPGDALYAVVSGRLNAFTQLEGGGERVYATYCNGDCFGEMPLLSGETHWASVRALNDSILLKIPRADFERALQREPRVALGFTRRMARRMKQLREEKQRTKWSTIIALYSAVPGAGKTLLATNLVASLARETGGQVLLLDLSGRQRGEPLAHCERIVTSECPEWADLVAHHALGYDRIHLQITGDEAERRLIAPLFGSLMKCYDHVLVDLPNQTCPSVFECLIQSDEIYIVTRSEEPHLSKTRMLLRDLHEHKQPVAPKARVVLTAVREYPAASMAAAREQLGQEIGYVLRWILEGEIVESVDGIPYVLRKPMEPYSLVVRRIARELGRTLVGLVLGSGGARGLAHIGVIRVLEREGIGIDVVAGSSIGALVGAGWAVGKSADELEEIALRVKNKRTFLRLLDPIFPGAGIIRGIRVFNFLHTIVNDLTFDDTMIPMRIVASDLDTAEEVVFRHGKLVDAIRASVSIPGVFRPVMIDGHTLVDGALSSPVPVGALAREGVSKIIAVNVIPTAGELRRFREAKEGAPRPADARPMHETGPLIETPRNVINVYMAAMHALQSRTAEDACAEADIVIRPTVPDSTWFDFYNPAQYIRRGEECVEAMLPQLKALTAERNG